MRLEQDGLVERERFRGAHVRYIDESELVELLEASGALKVVAVGYAAERVSDAEVEDLRALLAEIRTLVADGAGGGGQLARSQPAA